MHRGTNRGGKTRRLRIYIKQGLKEKPGSPDLISMIEDIHPNQPSQISVKSGDPITKENEEYSDESKNNNKSSDGSKNNNKSSDESENNNESSDESKKIKGSDQKENGTQKNTDNKSTVTSDSEGMENNSQSNNYSDESKDINDQSEPISAELNTQIRHEDDDSEISKRVKINLNICLSLSTTYKYPRLSLLNRNKFIPFNFQMYKDINPRIEFLRNTYSKNNISSHPLFEMKNDGFFYEKSNLEEYSSLESLSKCFCDMYNIRSYNFYHLDDKQDSDNQILDRFKQPDLKMIEIFYSDVEVNISIDDGISQKDNPIFKNLIKNYKLIWAIQKNGDFICIDQSFNGYLKQGKEKYRKSKFTAFLMCYKPIRY